MTEICTEIVIDASPERVWQVLTDFALYPDWNPVIRSVKGQARAGTRLDVYARILHGFNMSFQPTVLRAEPGRELRWYGSLFLAGLFSGEHSFTIEPIGKGQVRLIQREVYRGMLTPLFRLILRSSNRQTFDAMNRALKVRAERRT